MQCANSATKNWKPKTENWFCETDVKLKNYFLSKGMKLSIVIPETLRIDFKVLGLRIFPLCIGTVIREPNVSPIRLCKYTWLPSWSNISNPDLRSALTTSLPVTRGSLGTKQRPQLFQASVPFLLQGGGVLW